MVLRPKRWPAVTCAAFYVWPELGRYSTVHVLAFFCRGSLSKVYAVCILVGSGSSTSRLTTRSRSSILVWLVTLYVHGPGAFRLRWNRLLAVLGFGDSSLTPDGLRGGGAVAAYHIGQPVSDVQWRMRLKNLHTLEFYLQETAALNLLMEAGPDALQVIKLVSDLFEPLSKGL